MRVFVCCDCGRCGEAASRGRLPELCRDCRSARDHERYRERYVPVGERPFVCEVCGARGMAGARGRVPRFCQPCRRARVPSGTYKPKPAVAESTCRTCGDVFTYERAGSGGRRRITCSDACADAWKAKRRRAFFDTEHGRAVARASRQRQRAIRRRAVVTGTADAAFVRELLAHASACPLCGIEMTRTPYMHASMEVDHIVPLAAGGTHDRGNLRVICRSCNVRRPRNGSDVGAGGGADGAHGKAA